MLQETRVPSPWEEYAYRRNYNNVARIIEAYASEAPEQEIQEAQLSLLHLPTTEIKQSVLSMTDPTVGFIQAAVHLHAALPYLLADPNIFEELPYATVGKVMLQKMEQVGGLRNGERLVAQNFKRRLVSLRRSLRELSQ